MFIAQVQRPFLNVCYCNHLVTYINNNVFSLIS